MSKRMYAIQCSNCLRYLGISYKEQIQHIFCPDCAIELNKTITKPEASK